MKKFNIFTLGCKVNQYESEAIEKLFISNSYQKVDDGEKADVYIINTCSVTHMADRKSRQFISRAKKLNPEATIAVMGCYSQVSPDEIAQIEGVDVIMGTKNRGEILKLVERSMDQREKINVVEDIKKNQKFDELKTNTIRDMTRAYVKIQEGCNMFCTYCIIPYARGPISSRKIEDIIDEVGLLAKEGYKEVILTGIHVESYGKDKGKDYFRLIDVIEKVAEISGIERIRLSSIEPNSITDDFLSRLKASKKACDHFHLSLQSGSDSVLKAMNRKYTVEEYKEKIKLIRKYFPHAGITTDVIAGFPGESDKNHKETEKTLKEISFSQIHIFPFSRREGTPAYNLAGQLPNKVKSERTHALREIEKETTKDFLDSFIGKELEVLFENQSKDDRYTSGYSTNYLRVNVQNNPDLVNTIQKVKIVERKSNQLYGLLVK